MSDFLTGELKYSSSLTLQDQIYQILRNNILSKQLEKGHKLPTEEELCKAYNVSRSTVRAAFHELEKEGLIGRVRGKGTFVTDGKLKRKMDSVYSFTHQMNASGKKPSSKVLEFKQIEADERLSGIFQKSMGERLYLIERIRYADDVPLLVEKTYIPVNLCPELLPEELKNQSLYDLLINKGHTIPYIAEELYESVIMPPEICESLECSEGSAGFYIERIAKTKDERVYEYTNSFMRGDSSKLSVTLKSNDYFDKVEDKG